MPPRAIVTRPAREAAQWVRDLRARGIAADALPLIAIAPVADPAQREALRKARSSWESYRAVMFVSGNAVQHFFEQNQPPELTQQAPEAIKTRTWAPGPGTAAALRRAGIAPVCIDQPAPHAPQFDSEALWQAVAPQVGPGDRVLIVRGTGDSSAEGSGREWLAGRIAAAGGAVDFVAAYTRGAPRLDAAQHALARAAASDGSVWLLSSSEAVAHLSALLPGQPWGRARALATHGRVAAAAHAAGFGTVKECRPALDEVAASIESMHD